MRNLAILNQDSDALRLSTLTICDHEVSRVSNSCFLAFSRVAHWAFRLGPVSGSLLFIGKHCVSSYSAAI